MKKGFTLIEIIISIGLIALIGTVAMVSFNFIKKNNIEKKLENMSDAILTAVNVYIETNSEIKDELYNNKKGLKIPLSTLENSGLVDFSNIDVSDEYVVTMLGSTSPDDDTCASTYTAKSWDFKNGETIYICEKSDGSSNLAFIDPTKYGNKSTVTNEPYYFQGMDPANYIRLYEKIGEQYIGTNIRIYSVDRDDSLIVATDFYKKNYLYKEKDDAKVTDSSAVFSDYQFYNSLEDGYSRSWLGFYTIDFNEKVINNYNYKGYIRLKSTCKITSGTGMSDNPFQIIC